MTHVRTSPFYPQSNGKIKRWRKSRLNSATGHITPKYMLAGRRQEIHAERDRKLEAAARMRKDRRQQAA